jgi:glutaredoxin-dependent peroxiredoxin
VSVVAVDVGVKAPDFTLPSTIGDKFTLSEHFGKESVVLSFYVFDFSPVCTKEMCSFRDGLADLEKLNATVVGISIDSLWSHKAFAQSLNIKFPLLSDFNKEISRKYGVLYEDLRGLRGVSKRSVFVIDKEGVIRYRWVSEEPGKEPNYTEVQDILKSI